MRFPPAFVVTGTDTAIGKTVFSAALAGALDGAYWKPIQAGHDGETDAQTVARLAVLASDRILPSVYQLARAASPHLAAGDEGIDIRQRMLGLPTTSRPLVIEGAGGLMVPLSPRLLQIDLFGFWGQPLILCARTSLGTINHTLLSLEALRRRRVPVLGVAFIGAADPEVESTICVMGHVRRLGRLPVIDKLSPAKLKAAFAAEFDLESFVV
jgi:dethiobiotin synthetase